MSRQALSGIRLMPGQSVNATLTGPILIECGDGKIDKNTQEVKIQNGNIMMPYNSMMVTQPLMDRKTVSVHQVNITCQSKP